MDDRYSFCTMTIIVDNRQPETYVIYRKNSLSKTYYLECCSTITQSKDTDSCIEHRILDVCVPPLQKKQQK